MRGQLIEKQLPAGSEHKRMPKYFNEQSAQGCASDLQTAGVGQIC